MFKRSYEIAENGRPVTELSGFKRESCEFTVGGVAYRASRDGRKRFLLTGPNGPVADASRETRREWSIKAAEGNLKLKPRWRRWEVRRGAAVGAIRPVGVFARYFTADLPAGVSLPVQVFVLFVVLMIFERQRAAGAAGTSAAVAGS